FMIYKKIMEAGVIKQTSGWNEWVASFNNGETAVVVTGCWIIGSIKAEASQAGLWGVAPTPRLNLKTSVNYSNLGGSSRYVPARSQNPELEIDFMKNIFAADTDFYQKLLVGQVAIRTNLPAQRVSPFTDPDP